MFFSSTDWLREAVHGLKNNAPFVFHGWCEPEEIFCTVTENFCYVICADEGKVLETHEIKMTMLDFCKALHADISKDIFEWAYFEYYGDEFDGNEYRELHIRAEEIIKSLLDELAALIKERSKQG